MSKLFPINTFNNLQTPFYYYDTELLRKTLQELITERDKRTNYHIHYAIKANANPKLLKIISQFGLGADCVSGGEIKTALRAGFPHDKIVFAGVGKSDWEINLGLDANIFCFNVESIAELQVINSLAILRKKIARVAFRINPNVDAHTHANITTGLEENKFGISLNDVVKVIKMGNSMSNIQVVGLHFHIGSQIIEMNDFKALCKRINEIQHCLNNHNIRIPLINVGGGLGIDYNFPDENPIPTFNEYFETYEKHLEISSNQEIHFELGRSIIAQCGTLISRLLYVKKGTSKQFAILDAGMTDLIRPALYNAYHRIENISSNEEVEIYDVVGPICESSDVFAKDYKLNKCHRGDLIAIRSAGAYGEIMASRYNCREIPGSYITEEI